MYSYRFIVVKRNILKGALYSKGLTITEASKRLNAKPNTVLVMLHQPNAYWNWNIAHGLSRLAGTNKWYRIYEVKELVEVEAEDD